MSEMAQQITSMKEALHKAGWKESDECNDDGHKMTDKAGNTVCLLDLWESARDIKGFKHNSRYSVERLVWGNKNKDGKVFNRF